MSAQDSCANILARVELGGRMSESSTDFASTAATPAPETTGEGLLPQLVQHLRQNRTALREEWARRITEAELLTAMTPEELFAEATAVYDNYVEVLETGSVEALQAYARDLSERIIPRGVETDEVVGIVLLLRDVLARSLFEKYQTEFGLLNRVLDAYEPAANRIANTVAVSFVQERERIIRAAAGSHPGAVHAGAAGPRTAADPADHRCARQPARPPGHRAAAARRSAPTAPRWSSSTSPVCRPSTPPWPTTWCRRSTRPA